MKSSIFTTLRATLAAKTSPNVKKLSLAKMACIVSVFCAATAILSSAQPQFKSLLSFNGNNGANPYYVTLVQGTDGNLYGTTQVSTGSGGTVFKVTTGASLTTLHTFCESGDCSDGGEPLAGLVLATNGNFYGTTSSGGTYSLGTVFQITSAGAFNSLHSFDGTDGSEPEVAPVQASNGNLYGATTEGGTGGVGTIYQITSAGAFNSLHSFDGTDGDYPRGSLIQGTSGNLYGTTYEASGGVSGTVYDMTTAGGFSTLASFDPAEAAGSRGALIQASNGNFYGTDIGGGNGNGTVFEVTAAGTIKVLYTFCSKTDCADGASPYGALIQASDGNLYGTTAGGGASSPSCSGGCGTIFKITTAGALTTLYNFCSEANCADGSQPEGGLVQHTNGSFYGTTLYNGNADADAGTIYSLSVGLSPFVKTLTTSAQVGATVIILGTNLTGATEVTFNGVSAKFTVVSSTEITAIVPAGATSGVVTVVTPSGTLKTIVIFNVDATPQIKSFTPKKGPVGTTVTITGVNLTQTTKVTFDGIEATTFTVKSNTKLTAMVPEGTTTGTIAITTPAGTATSATSFTVTE
jgi:uncharacterized repeat protein (TIGR03803 family)